MQLYRFYDTVPFEFQLLTVETKRGLHHSVYSYFKVDKKRQYLNAKFKPINSICAYGTNTINLIYCPPLLVNRYKNMSNNIAKRYSMVINII